VCKDLIVPFSDHNYNNRRKESSLLLCKQMHATSRKARGLAFILHPGVVERKLSGVSDLAKSYCPQDRSVAVACNPTLVLVCAALTQAAGLLQGL